MSVDSDNIFDWHHNDARVSLDLVDIIYNIIQERNEEID